MTVFAIVQGDVENAAEYAKQAEIAGFFARPDASAPREQTPQAKAV